MEDESPADRAQSLYLSGTELFRQGNMMGALARFRASYELVHSPNSHLMIARALREQGQLLKAYREYLALAREADAAASADSKYQPTLEAAHRELAESKAALGFVEIRLRNVPPGIRVLLGEEEVTYDARQATYPVMPGQATVSILLRDGKAFRRNVESAAGRVVVLEIDLYSPPDTLESSVSERSRAEEDAELARRAESSSRNFRTASYVAAGGAALGLSSFVLFGMLDRSSYHSLVNGCPDTHCAPDREADIDRGRTQQTISNISLAAGVLALGLSGFFWYSAEREQQPRSQLQVGVGQGEVAVRGVFR